MIFFSLLLIIDCRYCPHHLAAASGPIYIARESRSLCQWAPSLTTFTWVTKGKMLCGSLAGYGNEISFFFLGPEDSHRFSPSGWCYLEEIINETLTKSGHPLTAVRGTLFGRISTNRTPIDSPRITLWLCFWEHWNHLNILAVNFNWSTGKKWIQMGWPAQMQVCGLSFIIIWCHFISIDSAFNILQLCFWV